MASRFQFSFGQGKAEAFLDLRSGKVFWYDSEESAEIVHATFGGKQYYRSRSGASGAGWIPASPAIKKLPTYRAEVAIPMVGDLEKIPEVFPGIKIVAPSWHKSVQEWPIILIKGYQHNSSPWGEYEDEFKELMFLDQFNLFRVLQEEKTYLEEKEQALVWIPRPESDPKERKVTFTVAPKSWAAHNARRVLTALFNFRMKFRPEEWNPEFPSRFWNPLGFKTVQNDARLYKVSQRVCTLVLDQENVEGIRANSPGNVHWVDENTYIQETSPGYFQARAFINLNDPDPGRLWETEVYLPLPIAIAAMQGEIAPMMELLKTQARKLEEEESVV